MPNLKKLEEIAYALEPNSRESRTFHVCAVYLKGKMISLATNSEKTHTQTKKYGYHHNARTHSEMRAILKLGERDDYDKLSIAILRLDMNNQLNMSKPCIGCSQMINAIGFKRVHWTNEKGIWVDSKPELLVNDGRQFKTYNRN